MEERNLSELSESEEMYLVTIAKLKESEQFEQIPLALVAERLNIRVVSANQMVRKLEENGLVVYEPYKGVTLTEIGRHKAAKMIRNRRLWEVFLVDHLNVPLNDAERLACRMEHITPGEISERLSQFLNDPQIDPHGKSIPLKGTEEDPAKNWLPLTELPMGETGRVMRFQGEPAMRSFIAYEGIFPGVEITVLGVGDQGGYLLEVNEKQFRLQQGIAEQIMVRR
ncbi:MAG: metal-dependent transcriptional regulator [Anaerolineaceae bacterium]|nr:metal-dependent transcriptional regulator [Anaerolineaceae bacterium]